MRITIGLSLAVLLIYGFSWLAGAWAKEALEAPTHRETLEEITRRLEKSVAAVVCMMLAAIVLAYTAVVISKTSIILAIVATLVGIVFICGISARGELEKIQ